MPLFDPAALKRIEDAVHDVEQRTASEIVVVTAPRSDAYHDVRLLYGIAFALGGAAIIHALFPTLSIGWLLWIEAGMIALMWLAFDLPALLRLLVPGPRAGAAVVRRARLEFLEHRVYDTRDHTGVLIFLSELEHRVVILGDAGIYAELHEEGFQGYVDRVIAAVRAGRAADGLCEVIADLGKKLAAHVPLQPGDVNELPNAVRQEKS